MSNWNPNNPQTLGLEWRPRTGGVVALDSNVKMAAVSYDQANSQAILTAGIEVQSMPVRGGLYAVEVYDNETGATGVGLQVLYAYPNEDVSGVGTGTGQWRTQANGTTTIYTTIDEVDPVDKSDYIYNGNGGANVEYNGRMSTGGLTLTAQRVLLVALQIDGLRTAVDNNTQIIWGLNIGGTEYRAPTLSPSFNVPFTSTANWYYNPATKRPWTIADVQAFDTTDEWFLAGNSTPDGGVYLYRARMTVVVVPENRIAVGVLDDTTSSLVAGWNYATMTTPTNGAWTKDGTGRHLWTVRRINTAGSINIPYLDAVDSVPTIAQGWSPSVDATYGYITAMNPGVTKIMPVLPRLTGPADSVDALPYAGFVDAWVWNAHNAYQQMSNAAAANYGILKFLVKMQGVPNADLLVKVWAGGVGGTQKGSTVNVTAGQVAALPDLGGGWKSVQVQLGTPAPLLTATQYTVEFSSTVTGAGPFWIVAAVDTLNSGNTGTYDGTTDFANVNNTASARYDLVVTLSSIPTAPATLTAAVGSLAVDPTVSCVASIPRADLSWTATSLAGSFVRYEIQRSEDAGATWVDIARVSLEAIVAWKDYEATRGIPVTYRIRVVRNDGAVSPWTTSGTMTKSLVSTGYLNISGVGGQYASTPDSAPTSVTLDIDIRVRVQSNDWFSPTFQTPMCKRVNSGQYGYAMFFYVGNVYFSWSNNGTTVNDVSAAFPAGMTGTWWVRATRVKKSGVVTFYLAPDSETEPTTWTQLGSTTVSSANVAIFDGTDPLFVGATDANGTNGIQGKVYRVIVYDGIGGDPYLVTNGVGLQSVQGTQTPLTTLSSSGDIDVRARIAPDVWNSSNFFAIAGISNGASGGWNFYIDNSGAPVFRYWSNGPVDNIMGGISTGFAPESAHWVRVTHDAQSGALNLYTAPDSTAEPTTWTLNLANTLSNVMTTTNAQLTVGSCPGLLGPADGKIYRVIVRAGLDATGTVIADFDPRKAVKVAPVTGTLYTDERGITYVGINSAAIRGIPVANPDFTAPDGYGTYWPNGLSDTAGNVWTVKGGAFVWVRDAQGDASMFLVSNYDPTYCLAYEYRPDKTFDFNEDAEKVSLGVHMRDYQLGFIPIEQRGSTAHYTLLIGADDRVPGGGAHEVAGRGVRAFDALRSLASAPLPYVTVIDSHGNHMNAMLRVPAGSESQNTALYITDIDAIEVTATPYVVTVAS